MGKKAATCKSFRHSFARHLLDYYQDSRTIQEVLTHKVVSNLMAYTHTQNRLPHFAMEGLDNHPARNGREDRDMSLMP